MNPVSSSILAIALTEPPSPEIAALALAALAVMAALAGYGALTRRRRRARPVIEGPPRPYDVADAAELEAMLFGATLAGPRPDATPEVERPVWLRRLDEPDGPADETGNLSG